MQQYKLIIRTPLTLHFGVGYLKKESAHNQKISEPIKLSLNFTYYFLQQRKFLNITITLQPLK